MHQGHGHDQKGLEEQKGQSSGHPGDQLALPEKRNHIR